MNKMESPTSGRIAATHWLMVAVLVWGLLLALGTFLFGGNQPLLRAAIVIGCTLGFLGLWIGALAARRRSRS